MDIWLLLLVPIVWAIISKLWFKHKVTIQEMFLHMGIACLFSLMAYFGALFTNTWDTQYVHGAVTGKEQVMVSCEHSYPCRCRQICSGSGNSRSCYTHCDTCYRHSHDWDWRVYATVGEVNIHRLDDQGKKEPPKWTAVYKGEPFTDARSFTNYLLIAKNSLFYRNSEEKWKKYPVIYDQYKYTQIILEGETGLNLDEWNKTMREHSAVEKKLFNILLIVANAPDMNAYTEKVKDVWKGAKINDVIVIVKPENGKASWVRVFTYGNNKGNEFLAVTLREALINQPLDKDTFIDVMYKTTSEDWKQVTSKEFEYLKHENQLSTTAFIVLMILILAVNIGLTVWTVKNEIEDYTI